MRKFRILLPALMLMAAILGCKAADQGLIIENREPSATPTASATSTEALPTATAAPTDTVQPPTPTTDAALEQTREALNRIATETAANLPTPTLTPGPASTQQAQAMAAIVKDLFEKGMAPSTDGTYSRLNDLTVTWNQAGRYQVTRANVSAANFVLTTNLKYETVAGNTNLPGSGCGLSFSFDDIENHHSVDYMLNGLVGIFQKTRGNWKTLTSRSNGAVPVPAGDARLMLAVYDGRINFFVDGDRVSNAYDGSAKEGELGFIIYTGTGTDFGMRCEFTDVDLWVFP